MYRVIMNGIMRLKKGDTIALVTPSWAGPAQYPWVFDQGIQRLKELGFVIKEFSSTRAGQAELQANPKLRADDINAAFRDPEVKGIIASIGGEDSIRILPYLDKEVVMKNPKFFMGFSDTTTLLVWLRMHGIISFHGPSVMAGFAEQGSFPTEFRDHLEAMLFSDWSRFTLRPYAEWTEQILPWEKKENLGIKRIFEPNKGWNVVNNVEGERRGELFGGCIEVLEFLKGTEYWPAKEFWSGKVLFLENSEEAPSIDRIKRILRNYGAQGVFERITGLLIGRGCNYDNDSKKDLERAVYQVVVEEYGGKHVPIIANMDFGHTFPQWILPIGGMVELDTGEKRLELIESPFIS